MGNQLLPHNLQLRAELPNSESWHLTFDSPTCTLLVQTDTTWVHICYDTSVPQGAPCLGIKKKALLLSGEPGSVRGKQEQNDLWAGRLHKRAAALLEDAGPGCAELPGTQGCEERTQVWRRGVLPRECACHCWHQAGPGSHPLLRRMATETPTPSNGRRTPMSPRSFHFHFISLALACTCSL